MTAATAATPARHGDAAAVVERGGGDTRLMKVFVGGLAWETSKEGVRVHFERFSEILEAVDHPFLPCLYGVAEGERWSCLLTEFCPGGDLHVLRQRQTHRRFSEAAVRYYATSSFVTTT